MFFLVKIKPVNKKLIITKSTTPEPATPLLSLIESFKSQEIDYEIISTRIEPLLPDEFKIYDLNPLHFHSIFDLLNHKKSKRPVPVAVDTAVEMLGMKKNGEQLVQIPGWKWFSKQDPAKIVNIDPNNRSITGVTFDKERKSVIFPWNGGQNVIREWNEDNTVWTYRTFDEETKKESIVFNQQNNQHINFKKNGKETTMQDLFVDMFKMYPEYLDSDIVIADDNDALDALLKMDLRDKNVELFVNRDYSELSKEQIKFIEKNVSKIFVPNEISKDRLETKVTDIDIVQLPFSISYQNPKIYYRNPEVKKVVIFANLNDLKIVDYLNAITEKEEIDEVLVIGKGDKEMEIKRETNGNVRFVGGSRMNNMRVYFENTILLINLEQKSESQAVEFEAISRQVPFIALADSDDAEYANKTFADIEEMSEMVDEIIGNITYEANLRTKAFQVSSKYTIDNFFKEVN